MLSRAELREYFCWLLGRIEDKKKIFRDFLTFSVKEFFKGILRLLPDMGDFACLSAAALQKVQHFDQCGLQVLGPPALSHQDRRPFQVESANVCKVIKKAH